MVRIRLRRIGLKGQPTYRIVAADKEAPRDGRFLEILGYYNPRTQPATIHIKEDRVFHWMKNGALPTESVAQVFKTAGTLQRWERFKKGEPLEVLLKEAEEAEAKRSAPGKTAK
ncbi:MAG TPA: 30S ribosomal protein S16 [Anaerolineales bacterium]|nr:30S ribosomal protein S16 [Anaerolineales bacterium]